MQRTSAAGPGCFYFCKLAINSRAASKSFFFGDRAKKEALNFS